MTDVDVLSNDIKPIKNSFGLPTGALNELGHQTEEEPTVLDAIETQPIEEEVVEAEIEKEEEVEPDILDFLGEEEPAAVEVTDASEMDRLRTEVARLQGAQEEQRRRFDDQIRHEQVAPEPEEEDDFDWENPEFADKVGQILEENPKVLPVLLNQMMDKKLKSMASKMEAMETQSVTTETQQKQADMLRGNLREGLMAAAELGETERRLVEQVRDVEATGDYSKSAFLQYLSKNPSFANSAEGVKVAVQALARQAEASARKKGLDISSMTKPKASDRSNRMLDKQTKPTADDKSDTPEKFLAEMKALNRHPLADLMGGR